MEGSGFQIHIGETTMSQARIPYEKLGYETKAIMQAIHNTEEAANHYTSGIWSFERVGKSNIYRVYVTIDPRAIVMTAANVTTQLNIPFPHRWLRIHFYHTDAAYATGVANLAVTLTRAVGTMFPVAFADDLFAEGLLVSSRIIETFGEGFEYEAGSYNLILNSTALHLIFPLFYIQKLETGEP